MVKQTPASHRFTLSLLRLLSLSLCAALPLEALAQLPASTATEARVSAFGDYYGYSAARYDGYTRYSRYVGNREGIDIAMDYYIPTLGGVEAEVELPVIFNMTPYNRAQIDEQGNITDAIMDSDTLRSFTEHGYVVAMADVRGKGASFGDYAGVTTAEEARDGDDMIEWLADQPWSTGKVGMYGGSYLGQMQYLFAGQQPPSLKALFPIHAMFDAYDPIAMNGVFFTGFQRYSQWIAELAGETVDEENRSVPMPTRRDIQKPAPVDGAEGRSKWEALMAEREKSDSTISDFQFQVFKWLFKARLMPMINGPTDNGMQSLAAHLPAIQEAAIPAYHFGGFYDNNPQQALRWYGNWRAPQKLILGPWTHNADEPKDPRGEAYKRLSRIESLRWFDYWLKGIDNGIMDEAPIMISSQSGGTYSQRALDQQYQSVAWEWHALENWPHPGAEATRFFLNAEPSGTIDSVNDGGLGTVAPGEPGEATFAVDASSTTGQGGRVFDSMGFGPVIFPDMRDADRRSLTYTTDVLAEDLLVIGVPTVQLFARSTASNGTLFAWLEEIDPDGYSTLVVEGRLKVSHRTLGTPAFNNFGDPWPTSAWRDVLFAEGFDDAIIELAFPLLPTATRFKAGKRLRLTIAGADADSFEIVYPDAEITLYHGRTYPSALVLPVVTESGRSPQS
ncbi:MAG: CocE/NonD family hydrolase [Pseudomonadota bacterium]